MAFLISSTKTIEKKKELNNQKIDNIEIIEALKKIKKDLLIANQSLDYATNQELIDSSIYEMKALQLKYQYYIKICKERGLSFSSMQNYF